MLYKLGSALGKRGYRTTRHSGLKCTWGDIRLGFDPGIDLRYTGGGSLRRRTGSCQQSALSRQLRKRFGGELSTLGGQSERSVGTAAGGAPALQKGGPTQKVKTAKRTQINRGKLL